ncbi:hypothetical protein QBC32DRAFT_348663 [Pseudoneurospora amorphoporcata]|uniref:Uncharacterized protein n=1 Tax=Pseudoneurospora amorphoporcata TaxID=241081 RepID=A0AAN6NRC0_9PEZI|nr:hypothetical protein QBC32DRAFT_348663 [Pseudoneurospora amorphoporcata]
MLRSMNGIAPLMDDNGDGADAGTLNCPAPPSTLRHLQEIINKHHLSRQSTYSPQSPSISTLYRQKHRYLSATFNTDRTEKIFWQEAKDWQTGTCHDLSAIHVVWGPADPVATMSGLIFEYGGGKIRSEVGSTSLPSATRKSLNLAEGETITQLYISRPVGTVRQDGFLFLGARRRVVDFRAFHSMELRTSLGQKAVFHREMPKPDVRAEQPEGNGLEISHPLYLFTREGMHDPSRAVHPSESMILAEREKHGTENVFYDMQNRLVGLGCDCRRAQLVVSYRYSPQTLGELYDDRLDPNTRPNGGRVRWYMRNKRCIQVC